MNFQLNLQAVIAALVLLSACHLAPAAPLAQRGAIAQPGATEIPQLCDKSIVQARARIARLKALPLKQVSVKTVLHTWNALDIGLQDMGGPIGLLAEVSPDSEVRKVAEACDLRLSALSNEYLQNAALFQRIRVLHTSDLVNAMARQSILDDFDERGVSLPPVQRERAKVIFERLDKLAQDFARNVRDASTQLAFSEAALHGALPGTLIHRARDAQGDYLFGLDYPEYDAIMNNVQVESTRKTFWTAFQRRGGQPNLDLLKEAVGLRLELAQLMGDASSIFQFRYEPEAGSVWCPLLLDLTGLKLEV